MNFVHYSIGVSTDVLVTVVLAAVIIVLVVVVVEC